MWWANNKICFGWNELDFIGPWSSGLYFFYLFKKKSELDFSGTEKQYCTFYSLNENTQLKTKKENRRKKFIVRRMAYLQKSINQVKELRKL